jgi:ABC-2 type transport system permease protein
MRSLANLTIANVRSFLRDRASLFWTFAFPIVFIVLFGTIFSSGGNGNYKIGWVDQDGTSASAALHQSFGAVPVFTLQDQPNLDAALDAFRRGDVNAVVVVPRDYAKAVAAAQTGVPNGGVAGASVNLTLYTDPSQQTTTGVIGGIVGAVVGHVNQGDRPSVVGIDAKTIQAQNLGAAAFFVPSILAMALMQLGLFGAIPLVQQREKLILKRLNATPLRRWTLIGSNIITRLVIGLIQTLLIIGVGALLFNVTILGSLLEVAALVVLGALMFISLGYVVASFVPTEESANMVTSILQFPLMFLSGIFFPLEQMPGWLRTIAAFLPLTYLGDALRQVMVGGTPFVPVIVSVAILGVWLVACFGVSARFFRWQ